MRNKIVLINDSLQEANIMMTKLEQIAQEKSTPECQFEFVFLQGTEEGEISHEPYLFYKEDVIDQIKDLAQNVQLGERICLLLDFMLQEKDYINVLNSNYPKIELAKKIYYQFRKKMPIYMFSRSPWFATKCDVIMGANLSNQFITRDALVRYNNQDAINKMFEFYSEDMDNI